MIYPQEKRECSGFKKHKKIYPTEAGEARPLYQIQSDKRSLNDTNQLNMMATVANEGYYYTPHIIKKIKGTAIDPKFKVKHQTTIDKKVF
jgi:penicillin-binding protein 2